MELDGGLLTNPYFANGPVSILNPERMIATEPKSKLNSHHSKTLRNIGGGGGYLAAQTILR
jgi:hypothetical protein